jgi:hypothetical protein
MVDKTFVKKEYGRHFSLKTLQFWVVVRGAPPSSLFRKLVVYQKGGS